MTTDRTEADAPPVARIAQLDDVTRELAERGLGQWQRGELADARQTLEDLLALATDRHHNDAVFHALHLLGNVAFSERDFALSTRLHTQVLDLCTEIGFLGGAASSLFNLAMVAE